MKKDDIYRSQFRLPYSLYEKLKESAEANNRSVNSELIYRLEESLHYDEQLKSTQKSVQAIMSSREDINSAEQFPAHRQMQLLVAQIVADLKKASQSIKKLNKENEE